MKKKMSLRNSKRIWFICLLIRYKTVKVFAKIELPCLTYMAIYFHNNNIYANYAHRCVCPVNDVFVIYVY